MTADTSYGKNRRQSSRLLERSQSVQQRALISAYDLLIASALIVSAPVAVLLPKRVWMAGCRALAGIIPSRIASFGSLESMAAATGRSEDACRTIARSSIANRLISLLCLLRRRSRNDGPQISLSGIEHIDAATAQGRGCVLWFADMVFAGDAIRCALDAHGIRTTHMSRLGHGFSETRFGIRYLNPVRLRFEERFMKDRIVYDRDKPSKSVAAMIRVLKKNGVLSIVACATEGALIAETDFLHGRLQLAAGAPKIAVRNNCPVLPVFCRPGKDISTFEVIVGEPLSLSGDQDDARVIAAVDDFARRYEAFVGGHLELFRGWRDMRPGDVPASVVRMAKAGRNSKNAKTGVSAQHSKVA